MAKLLEKKKKKKTGRRISYSELKDDFNYFSSFVHSIKLLFVFLFFQSIYEFVRFDYLIVVC